ncbi:MAG: proton-conducting transporter membrane subunit [Acidobacteriota bacterium]
METNELSLIIIIPLIAGLINIFLPRRLQKGMVLLVMICSLFLVYRIFISPQETVYLFREAVFSLDKLGLFALVFIQILSFIILLFSLKGVSPETEKRFFILYPLTVAFCNGVVASVNSISFIIFWGLSGLTLYLFATLKTSGDAPKTAKKTFIIAGGSDTFMIMGFVLMSRLLPQGGYSLNNLHIPLSSGVSYLAFFFLLIASLAKAGGFPLHTWVPDFCKDSPIESAALLPAANDKLLGIYLLARMMTSYFSVSVLINMIIVSLGAITVITAVMMALYQHNGRRLLGYHAVSQVGYMIMGIGSGNVLAYAGGLFHLINHTIYKSGLFLSLGSVEKKTKTNELDYLGGLGRNMPMTFIASLISALSISGIPPYNGFFSKWMIYQGLLEKTKTLSEGYQLWMMVCLLVALFGSVLTLGSFMKFIHAVFLGRRPEIYENIREAPFNQWISTALLSLLCIMFGLFALEIPLKGFIYPVSAEQTGAIPAFTGLYDPQFIFVAFALMHILAIIIYSIIARVRFDDQYLGGSLPLEKFRISGAEFYNEIRNMRPLKAVYDWADKKYFDIYEILGKMTFGVSGVLQKAHTGQLQLYVLYIILGMLLLILLI